MATVTVTPNPADVQVGVTLQLTATLKDANGNQLSGRTVTWTSDATDKATVDGNGVVTGVAEGTTNINAQSEGKTGSTTTRVAQLPPTAFDGILIPPGGKFPLDILYQAYKNALEQLTWARFIRWRRQHHSHPAL